MPTTKQYQLIQDIRGSLKQTFWERDSIIDAMLVAVLARQHMLLLGPPGTAKSLVIQAFTKRLQGGSYFEWLLTPFSAPEELFGPPSLKALEQDRYERVTTGKLPEADFAFLDEIFKANSSILNSLLTMLNERAFDNGTKRQDCPLISCFGASNELPQDESLRALYDRFVFRFDVPYLADGDNFEALLRSVSAGTFDPMQGKTITKDELIGCQTDSQAVTMGNPVISKLREIKAKLEQEGVVASDRKWVQLIPVMKANAYLHGRDEVDTADIEILVDSLWDEPNQRRVVRKVVLEEINPAYFEVLEHLDVATEVFKGWTPQSEPHVTTEISMKLSKELEKIETIYKVLKQGKADGQNITQVEDVRRQVMHMYKSVVKNTI